MLSTLDQSTKVLALTLTCILFSLFSFAQDQAYLDSLEQVTLTAENDTFRLDAHDKLRRYYVRVELEKAKFHAQEAIKIAKQLKMPHPVNKGRISLGQVLFYKGEYQGAIENFLTAEPFYAEKKDSIFLGAIYNGLAACYQESNDSIAMNYFQKAYSIYADVHPKKAGIALANIGNVHSENKRYEQAIKTLRKAVALFDPIKEKYYFNIANLNLANALSEIASYEEAEKIYRAILVSYKDKENFDLKAFALGGLGYCQYKKKQYKIATINLEQAVTMGEKIGIQEDLLPKILDLSNTYKATSDYKNAYLTLVKHKTLTDSLFSKEKEQILADAVSKYEGEKKDQEISLLNTESELATLKYEKTNRARLFFIALSIGLLLFAGLLYKLIQDRKKANRKLKIQNERINKALSEKEMLLREIHHRVKNNLQVISSLLSIQSRKIDDPSALEAMQESRNRVQSMALIHQNLYQDQELVGVGTKDYIEKLALSLVQNYKVGDNQVEVKTDIDDVKLDVDTIIPLGLILNELITNALKYAFVEQKDGKIFIELKKNNEDLILKVSDNGVGLPESFGSQKNSGIGFRLIDAFSKKLGAKLNIENQSKGTKVSMCISNFKAA